MSKLHDCQKCGTKHKRRACPQCAFRANSRGFAKTKAKPSSCPRCGGRKKGFLGKCLGCGLKY